jgi:transglutaminase-like putative cysteine protease
MTGPAADDRGITIAAEVGLLAVTLASVIGMHRLFATSDWVAPLMIHATAAHVVATVLRRRGVSLGVSALAMVAAAGLVTAWVSYWATTTVGIPTGATVTAFRADLSDAWTLYRDVVAPAPVQTGFVVASALALWAIAFVADWAAFRLWVPFEATLPAGTLFLFTALLGADQGRAAAAGIYAAALIGFLLLHRVARQEVTSHWVSEHRTDGRRSLLIAGSSLGVLAVLVGTVLGPNLPGADAPGVLDPRDLNEQDNARVTVSPLVDIRSRLVDQSNLEVFTVRSTARAYWRLTSLERFDGRIWSSSGSYSKADGDLPEAVRTDVAKEDIDQTYTIEALSAIWLPSAFEARGFTTDDDVEARYDKASSTLIVDNSVPTSDGLTYDVTSAAPRFDAAELAGDDATPPASIREDYLALPRDFSPRVRQLAQELVAGQATPYAQALAIQNHLRTFTYDLTVQAGHSDDVLEQFLFDTQRGYCEQFAGSFAAMARAVGLPARVAVGFTPGDVDPSDASLFHVRGEHAHAWPEVYLEGAGWVPFEPTPGRGIPSAEPYTGVPEAQAATGQPNETEAAPAVVVPVPVPTTAPDPTDPDQAGTDPGEDESKVEEEHEDPSNVERFLINPARRAAPWVLVGLGLYGLGCPALLLLQRRWRRQRATGAGAQIALAWTEAGEEAALAGYVASASDTPAARARRLADLLPDAGSNALHLARLVEAAHYAPSGVDPAAVPDAWADSAAVGRVARAAATWRSRAARWFDPRPPLRVWRAERTAGQRQITTEPTGTRENERLLVGVGATSELEE